MELETAGDAPGATAANYRRVFDRRSAPELHRLALIKRVLERFSGDDDFRDELKAAMAAGTGFAEFSSRHDPGIELEGLVPLLCSVDEAQYSAGLASGAFHDAASWRQYIVEILEHRELIRRSGCSGGLNPRFDQWRERQMRRCNGELGPSNRAIVHPVIAFELSDGCSLGCWFCGISAKKFGGYFAYEENWTFWREVLHHTRLFFGPAAQTGFCYWGTDPADNPDYPAFIEDYYHVIGALPQTTTAAPLRDLGHTRRILALFDKYRAITNRFSILSKRALRQVHEAFTADELMGVELVLQNREGDITKASAGRVRTRALARGDPVPDSPASTIACVSGFLVNMVHRRVQLVTPTRASDRWPDGYWVIAEIGFEDAVSFGEALRELANTHMKERGSPSDKLSLRPDLQLSLSDGALTLSDSGAVHRVDVPFAAKLHAMLSASDRTVGEAICDLVMDGVDFFHASAVVQDLFTAGLLDEDPRASAAGAVSSAVPS